MHGVLPDTMINLILSFNLQFDNFTENVVLEAMEQIKTAKTFTEKILVLINREGRAGLPFCVALQRGSFVYNFSVFSQLETFAANFCYFLIEKTWILF